MLTPRKVTDVTYVIPHGQHQQATTHDPFNDGTHAGVLMPDGATMADMVRASLIALPERQL